MLSVSDLCAGYGGDDVLHGLSFELAAGESLAIIGPNGCGKTTLLKAIAGLMPFRGQITLDGRPIAAMSRREAARSVALLGQMPTMQPGYTVRETVMLGRYAHSRPGLLGQAGEDDKAAVDEALMAVNLMPLAERDVATLSGGQLQRVFAAKTLAQNPQVILLDEPTNHLDLRNQVELVDYLVDWSRSRKRTVVGVLHDVNLATMLSNNVLLMSDGHAAAFGAMETALTAELMSEVYGIDVASYMKNSFARWARIAPMKGENDNEQN